MHHHDRHQLIDVMPWESVEVVYLSDSTYVVLMETEGAWTAKE